MRNFFESIFGARSKKGGIADGRETTRAKRGARGLRLPDVLKTPGRKGQEASDTEERIRVMLDSEDSIRDLGHAIVASFGDVFKGEALRTQVLNAQMTFSEAVARLTGCTLEQIERWRKEVRGTLGRPTILDIETYLPSDISSGVEEEDPETAHEVLEGEGVETRDLRRLHADASTQVRRAALLDVTGQDISRVNVLERRADEAKNPHIGLHRALQRLEDEAGKEVADSLRGFEHARFERLVKGVNEALVKLGLNSSSGRDGREAVAIAVREVVRELLLDRQKTWEEMMYASINEFHEYSPDETDGHEPITHEKFLEVVNTYLQNEAWITERAKKDKEKLEDRIRELQTVDLFLSELERARTRTRTEFSKMSKVDPDIRLIGKREPEEFLLGIQAAVQSLTGAEIRSIFNMSKDEVGRYMESTFHDDGNENRRLFKKFLVHALYASNLDKHLRYEQRDGFAYLQRDIEEEIREKTLKAKKPLDSFKREVRAGLRAREARSQDILQAKEDIEDLIHRRTLVEVRLREIGERVNLVEVTDGLWTLANDKLNWLKELHMGRLDELSKAVASGKFERREEDDWLEAHPIKAWKKGRP